MSREEFEHHVAEIMDTFTGDGGTSDYVDYVLEHNGGLSRFSTDMMRTALEETVKRLIRTERLPEHGNVRRFASVMVATENLDGEGNIIQKRVYVSAHRLLFDREDYLCDQVVDYHIGRSQYHRREANRWVAQRRIATEGIYQRELPFPDLQPA